MACADAYSLLPQARQDTDSGHDEEELQPGMAPAKLNVDEDRKSSAFDDDHDGDEQPGQQQFDTVGLDIWPASWCGDGI